MGWRKRMECRTGPRSVRGLLLVLGGMLFVPAFLPGAYGAPLAARVAPGAASTTAEAAYPVRVEILEDVPAGRELDPPADSKVTEVYRESAFGFVRIPTRYSPNALPLDRSTPFVLRAELEESPPAGEYEFRLRARGAARFLLDGKPLLGTKP